MSSGVYTKVIENKKSLILTSISTMSLSSYITTITKQLLSILMAYTIK